METEIVKDEKNARPCTCGHAAAAHELDGVGRCTAPGCTCLGPLLDAETEQTEDVDEE